MPNDNIKTSKSRQNKMSNWLFHRMWHMQVTPSIQFQCNLTCMYKYIFPRINKFTNEIEQSQRQTHTCLSNLQTTLKKGNIPTTTKKKQSINFLQIKFITFCMNLFKKMKMILKLLLLHKLIVFCWNW